MVSFFVVAEYKYDRKPIPIQGTTIILDDPDVLDAWIAERKRRWPSANLVEEKKRKREEAITGDGDGDASACRVKVEEEALHTENRQSRTRSCTMLFRIPVPSTPVVYPKHTRTRKGSSRETRTDVRPGPYARDGCGSNE